ncbi:hypothetical protein BRM22_19520 [Xanthomonas oryzae pv. oryzae]|nr:hypothetical protein BRM60_19255 [Xanthomonas oryzae pv. oryzae]AXX68480.1 hypothetical protein B4599_18985 [Xanthomonas oryzae pv. oryzae]RBC90959.1 hypothetical protein BRN02_24455 [Xanthomonas oryzae pv. oryzae]RBD11168.1 hypothetical protein BRM27_11655 [Xanthomonas oryzae pv. oryzae]RBD27004.1 hypothetical protein BRM21_16205 [Xanthomonas oryzae pv. oryzae]
MIQRIQAGAAHGLHWLAGLILRADGCIAHRGDSRVLMSQTAMVMRCAGFLHQWLPRLADADRCTTSSNRFASSTHPAIAHMPGERYSKRWPRRLRRRHSSCPACIPMRRVIVITLPVPVGHRRAATITWTTALQSGPPFLQASSPIRQLTPVPPSPQ